MLTATQKERHITKTIKRSHSTRCKWSVRPGILQFSEFMTLHTLNSFKFPKHFPKSLDRSGFDRPALCRRHIEWSLCLIWQWLPYMYWTPFFSLTNRKASWLASFWVRSVSNLTIKRATVVVNTPSYFYICLSNILFWNWLWKSGS